jgi:hypothetical protein
MKDTPKARIPKTQELERLEVAVRALDELQALYFRTSNGPLRESVQTMIDSLLERSFELRDLLSIQTRIQA